MGCYCLLQRDFPDPGIKLTSLALASGFFPTEPPGKPLTPTTHRLSGFGCSMDRCSQSSSFRCSSGWDGIGVGLSLAGICLFVFPSLLQVSEICLQNMDPPVIAHRIPCFPILDLILYLSTRNQEPSFVKWMIFFRCFPKPANMQRVLLYTVLEYLGNSPGKWQSVLQLREHIFNSTLEVV